MVGAKVIAIAGADDKCHWLETELGVDKAINYKSPTFHTDFKKAVGYFDVYFDNVGGEILNYALTRMKKHARIAFCGSISDYSEFFFILLYFIFCFFCLRFLRLRGELILRMLIFLFRCRPQRTYELHEPYLAERETGRFHCVSHA